MPKIVPVDAECLQHSRQIDDYCLGNLDPSAVERLEEHYLICPSCADQVATTQEFLWAFRSMFAHPNSSYQNSRNYSSSG
ncbi:MAG: zf-HC2 domain-containing protein [Bryobacterales bacterium]|nr:zf-HC2 domain-containing protein [Bryobacterales bacterium]